MTAISGTTKSYTPKEAATLIQQRFRHHRYLKRNQNKGDPYLEPLFVRKLNREEFRKFSNIISSWSSQWNYISLARELLADDTKVLAIFDRANCAQGFLTYYSRTEHIWICHVVTAPWNLGKGNIRGVGTALIERLIHIATPSYKEDLIEFYSLDDAIPFYKKLGFVFSTPTQGHFPATERATFLNNFAGRALPACRR